MNAFHPATNQARPLKHRLEVDCGYVHDLRLVDDAVPVRGQSCLQGPDRQDVTVPVRGRVR